MKQEKEAKEKEEPNMKGNEKTFADRKTAIKIVFTNSILRLLVMGYIMHLGFSVLQDSYSRTETVNYLVIIAASAIIIGAIIVILISIKGVIHTIRYSPEEK